MSTLHANTPRPADAWESWTDDVRWMPTVEEYPGLTGPQVLLVQLYEQAVRLRSDMPTTRRCADLLDCSINNVVQIRKILFRKSWIEEQPRVFYKHGIRQNKRYRLTEAALHRMAQRDARAQAQKGA